MHNRVSEVLKGKGPEVVTVRRGATVLEAVTLMNEAGIGSLVVLDQEKAAGIFTERDVLVRVVAEQRDPATTPVWKVMTEDPITISPDTTVNEAMQTITTHRCRHLPVFDDGSLVGMISIGDLTRWMVDQQRHQITDLETYVMRG